MPEGNLNVRGSLISSFAILSIAFPTDRAARSRQSKIHEAKDVEDSPGRRQAELLPSTERVDEEHLAA